mgnify:CR=1 FL=1
MKKILLLATGGTIASRPTAAGGLAPAITSEELLACVPELADLCEVSAVQVFNLDSTNVGPAQWQSIVRCIKENYDACDGFVIAHGTDTMAYTAAALSYMVQNSAKPVVLTGSQKSIYNRDTDARNNLYRAFVYAVSDGAWSVQHVYDNTVILGHTRSQDADAQFQCVFQHRLPRDRGVPRYAAGDVSAPPHGPAARAVL